MTPSDGDLTVAGEALDLFAPARVDDTIAAALLDPERASGSPEGRLVLALAAGHALPAGADAAVERVRARLATAPLAQPSTSVDRHAPVAPSPARHIVPSPISRVQNTLRAIAAVLVVALLAGGFVVALHGHQGNLTSASRWVDASITHAHTTRPLDFNHANGISYAVAQTGGDIYACSGTSLWYSDDGGGTYAPFAPAPPPGTMDGACTLGTVQGLPGVFVEYSLGPTQRVSYGALGGTWRVVGFPGAVHAAAVDPSGSLPVLAVPQGQDYQDITRPLFLLSFNLPGLNASHLAQYADQWLFLIVKEPLATPVAGTPTSALIATRDFGKTWVWLDATLFSQSQQECFSVVVMPSDSSTLGCLTENPDARPITTGLALSSDFGGTWNTSDTGSATPLAIAGADSQSIFYVRNSTGAIRQLVRYDPAAGRSFVLSTLPDWMPQGSAFVVPPVALMPDGTVYQAFASGSTGAISVGLDAVAPGASRATHSVPAATIHAKGLTPALAFGDLDGPAPALYLGAGNALNSGDISPLYRLALPAPTAPPQPTTVVQFPTVPAPSTPQPRPQCAGDPETTAAIQPGGLGALSSTFAPRWGGDAGVALGTTYFGRYQDTGMPIVGVPSMALATNARVPNLTYHVDSTAHLTLAQAQALAATILPADAHPIPNGAPPSTVSPITYAYCSAAFWAAFPPPSPNFTYGELAVAYYLRSDGSVDAIDFSPATIG